LKKYERKSFLTTTLLFFIPLSLFTSLVLYMYYEDKVKDMEENILYQMKDYTFDFKSKHFILDVIENKEDKKLFKIYHCKEGLCAYFKMNSAAPYLLKVIYEKKNLEKKHSAFFIKMIKFSLLLFSSLLFFSMAFAYYSMRPMKEALRFLEDFLKDLIHDLNTPATSILLNAKLLKRRGDFEEIGRIELAAKTIASLYKNLEFISPNSIDKNEQVNLADITKEKVSLFEKLYPKIKIDIKYNTKELIIQSNKIAMQRILDNIISNACKYNVKNGQVIITIEDNKIAIQDSGIGIKNVKKVFERYYKENETGLGIGLGIVKQLCDILKIRILISSEINTGTKVELLF